MALSFNGKTESSGKLFFGVFVMADVPEACIPLGLPLWGQLSASHQRERGIALPGLPLVVFRMIRLGFWPGLRTAVRHAAKPLSA